MVSAPAPEAIHQSPYDPAIPVIHTGSPEFAALVRSLNKAV